MVDPLKEVVVASSDIRELIGVVVERGLGLTLEDLRQSGVVHDHPLQIAGHSLLRESQVLIPTSSFEMAVQASVDRAFDHSIEVFLGFDGRVVFAIGLIFGDLATGDVPIQKVAVGFTLGQAVQGVRRVDRV